MNFKRHDLEDILYSLEGYIQGNDDEELCDRLVDICYRIENKLSDLDVTNSDKVYPEVEDVPEQVYKEWLTSTDDNYGDKVDSLVDRMKSTK